MYRIGTIPKRNSRYSNDRLVPIKAIRALAAVGALLACAAVVMLGIACSDSGPTSPGGVSGNVSNTSFVAEASFSSDVPVTNQSRLTLRGINSNIAIRGGSDSDSVLISGMRRVRSESPSDAQANLELLEVRVTEMGEEIVVQTIQPEDSGGRSFEVDYTITPPQSLEVSVTNVNGGVAVDNISAAVTVVNVNGEVDLRNVSGGAAVELVNGQIDATATLPRAGTIELTLVNGNVELEIPRATSAELAATVSNGTITLSDLTLENRTETPTSLRGTLGDGDATITLTTVNGTIRIAGF